MTRDCVDHVENTLQNKEIAQQDSDEPAMAAREPVEASAPHPAPRLASSPARTKAGLPQRPEPPEALPSPAKMLNDTPGASPHRDPAAARGERQQQGTTAAGGAAEANGVESAAWRQSVVRELDARDALARESVRAASDAALHSDAASNTSAESSTSAIVAASHTAAPPPGPPYASFPLAYEGGSRHTQRPLYATVVSRPPSSSGARPPAPRETGRTSPPSGATPSLFRRSTASEVSNNASGAGRPTNPIDGGERRGSTRVSPPAAGSRRIADASPRRSSAPPSRASAQENAAVAMIALRGSDAVGRRGGSEANGSNRERSSSMATRSPAPRELPPSPASSWSTRTRATSSLSRSTTSYNTGTSTNVTTPSEREGNPAEERKRSASPIRSTSQPTVSDAEMQVEARDASPPAPR